MALDQNSLPMDLRPLNVARTVVEESRIAPVTTAGRNMEGFYLNPSLQSGIPGSIPVYYPATVSDAGFVGVGYGNTAPGVTGWIQRMPPPSAVVGAPGVTSPALSGAPGTPSVTTPPGYSNSPIFGNRVGSNRSDQTSDEGADESVSGKKVKLLCSFGGKILPRPNDGVLRYVGGQTRIISVRRDASFNEFVQKMADSYGQNVVIKYQLPEEDLDALVSVSCPDDLENMMDEYEKLVERSSDGSAKLRVFLYSASELDSSGIVQMGDVQDSGQRYIEAVNGIVDGARGGLTRRESMTSATSTQNSDLSGIEAIDNNGHGQVEVTGPPTTGGLLPNNNSALSPETAPRFEDPNTAVNVEGSNVPVGVQMVRTQPPPILSAQYVTSVLPQQQQQMGFSLQQQQMGFPSRAPYFHSYVGPQQETLSRADYVQYPSHMGFPAQILGTAGPMFTQQQYRDSVVNVSPHQFIPAVHMTLAAPSHASIRASAVQPIVQSQQVQFERYPEESKFGQRVIQHPGDQSYNAYHAQVSQYPTVLGGFERHQVPQPEQVPFSEGWVPQQQLVFPEKVARFEDCHMCQKDLPHAHSDTIAQNQRDSPTTTIPDFNMVYHSLQMEDTLRGQLINRVAVSGPMPEGSVENQVTGAPMRVFDHSNNEATKPQYEGIVVSHNVEEHNNDGIVLQGENNHDHPLTSVSQGVVGGFQSQYGVLVGTVPLLHQENVVLKHVEPTQYKARQEALMNKVVNISSASTSDSYSQTPDLLTNESSKEYSGKLPGIISKEGILEASLAYEQLRQIDGRMENLGIRPSEVLLNNEQGNSQGFNSRKEDIIDNRGHLVEGRELYIDNGFSKSNKVLDTNCYIQGEILPGPSNEVPYSHNIQPADSYEVTQQPMSVNPGYTHQGLVINHLDPDHISQENSTSSQVIDQISPLSEWKDNSPRFQQYMACTDKEALNIDGSRPNALSPSDGVGDAQDNSKSLFSSQDPWNLRHGTHFPPPRPNKILTRKEVYGTRDLSGESRFGNSGESTAGNAGGLMTELQPDGGFCLPSGNLDTEYSVQSSKGSAEEHIKQELQAVAEGVAASVLQTSIRSNPDAFIDGKSGSASEANQDSEFQRSNVEILRTDKSEDLKSKPAEKTNLGFPVSDGIGRLQIIKNDDLEELRELGSGTFGTVYHGKWRGSDVAIKRINDRCFSGKPSEQERMRDDFWNEAIKLADLHHPNVVAFYGVVLDGPGGSVATVTEFMVNGSLRTALQKNEKNLDKRKRLLIAMDVAFGMEYLHGKNIVHFDLKSDNLLVNLRDPHRPICKVGDLGLSKVKCQTLISGGVRGTLPWMAPELLNGSSSLVSEKVDVFSFGIVLWELLTGEEPYEDLHYGAIIGGIVNNTLRPLVPDYCDPEWKSLMERCWSAEPSERPNFTEIANQLRNMVANVPPKTQAQQQQPPSTQFQVKV